MLKWNAFMYLFSVNLPLSAEDRVEMVQTKNKN